MNYQNVIELEKFRSPGAKVFTGRDRGKKVREDSHIDDIEAANEEVTIVIPDNVYSIIPSFFEELFLNSVLKLGRDRFLNKFKFQSLGNYKYEKPLNEAIDRILRKTTAIG
ncbi:STAS-like domain-containing protein [Pedobacter miscanthi]|uniref:STAS-like domain-containing protein n=1 Tax=Pedobacter miscanthi TaxID=2259170 RepID=UPI0029313491|nr:DUF4325 domain-containing protein [Pedobacter miscanthi]